MKWKLPSKFSVSASHWTVGSFSPIFGICKPPVVTSYYAVFVCRHPCQIATNCFERTEAPYWGFNVTHIFVKTSPATYSLHQYVSADDTILVPLWANNCSIYPHVWNDLLAVTNYLRAKFNLNIVPQLYLFSMWLIVMIYPPKFCKGNTLLYIGKYIFVNRTIQHWNQIPAEVLGTLPCHPITFKKRARKVIIELNWKEVKECWKSSISEEKQSKVKRRVKSEVKSLKGSPNMKSSEV